MSSATEERLLRQLEGLQRENEQLRSRASTESHSRLMAEAALGQTEDRLQLALDAAGLAMWEWDIAGRTVFTSAQFEVIVEGFLPADAADREWLAEVLVEKVVAQDHVALREACVRVLKQTDARLDLELRMLTQAGQAWMECTGRVTQRDMFGRAERMVGVVRDVSRRREIQQEMEAARAAAVLANAAKDQFLAHISHEIRTPLNGVIGMNDLLSKTELTPEQRNYVDLLGSSGRSLLDLVNDVLDFARIEAQGVVLEQVRFPLRAWLRELVEPQRIAAQAKGLQLLVQVAQDLPQEVVGDPGRLRQIASNLLNNAIKFTQRGRVEISLQTSHRMGQLLELQLQVRDTGIGIAPHKQKTIFDAFMQADSSTSRHYGGTGLGLSICAKLAQLMGGKIELESALEQGSCFTAHIPVGQARDDIIATQFGLGDVAESVLQPAHAVQTYAGKCALVVDDNLVNQLLASKLMQRLGFEVMVAEDGKQALRAVDDVALDVVLMDIQMPEMNGWEATQAIRQAERARQRRHVPIIALSAHASAADRDQSMAMGMDGYLTKPLTPEALQAALQTVLNGVATAEPASPDIVPAGVVNHQLLLTRLRGDAAAVHEMAQAFRHDLRERLGVAFQALQKQDWPTLIAQSHALKGALLTMTAQFAASDAKALELAARAQDHAVAIRAFQSLSDSSKAAFAAVQSW